ncbi:polysaccharide biosynthesis tyrosine autokinase [Pseudanabaenaceae cyanobacterium LEGE 13415]|nr:polysaccharide biosynthesis tyrosine autokinase [Pseudanabaenaceae cyanobacterium LEGE 13415]
MELQQYWLVLKRRWLPASAAFVLVSTFTGVAFIRQEPIFEAQGKLRFKAADTTASLTGVAADRASLAPLVDGTNPMTTEMEVIRSVPIVQATIKQLELKNEDGELLTHSQFLRRLTLTNLRGTDVLQISFQSDDSELTKRVVDTLMSLYLQHHLQDHRAEAVAARKFIEQQLPDAEANVRKAEADLRQFKETNQVAALDEEARVAVEEMGELQRRVADVRSELASADAETNSFGEQLQMNPREALVMAALSQSTGVQEALRALQTVESQLATERARFTETHPAVEALLVRKANLQAVLDSRIAETVNGETLKENPNLQMGDLQPALIGDYVRTEVRRRGLAQQANLLASAGSAYQKRINQLPRLEQVQRELTRQLEAAQTTYSQLLQRFHEVRVAENQNVGNARIIQQAFILDRPIAPRLESYLALGGVAGVVFAIATALVLDNKDKSIRTVKAARDLFGYTLLGVIPLHRQPRKLAWGEDIDQPWAEVVVQTLPRSPISEAYRMLQANLKMLSSDQVVKTIVVTSTVPNEGKSTVAANLAAARAQSGQRVLLIDADMHRPHQHHFWNVVNDVGLSNIIVEQTEPRAVVKHITANLDVLTAGVLPPNPAVLLDSQRMASLLEQFAEYYDFVIIDTPAFNVASEVQAVGRMSDGIVLVTRPGVVDAANAEFTKERLEQSGQRVLGQVVNGVIFKNEPYSYYHFLQNYYGEEVEEATSVTTRV